MPNVIISGKDFKLNQTLQNYVAKKMEKISKLASLPIKSIKVELDADKNQKSGQIYRAEMSVQLPGKILKSGQKGYNMREAIDLCLPKLAEQVTKYKDKMLTKKKGHHPSSL
jgi:putative sigma-54 modulation protein